MIPGEYITGEAPIEANTNRPVVKLAVVNTGDRPVQVGSHYHFFEVNRMMDFKREMAFGYRLNIPAGTAVRFEPGEEKEVELVLIGGAKKIYGFSNLTNGSIEAPGKREEAIQALNINKFKTGHS